MPPPHVLKLFTDPLLRGKQMVLAVCTVLMAIFAQQLRPSVLKRASRKLIYEVNFQSISTFTPRIQNRLCMTVRVW